MQRDVLSEGTQARARSQGPEGLAWLAEVDNLVQGLCADWDLVVERNLLGGSGSWVARVRQADGTQAVLKVCLPWAGFATQVDTMVRADGQGYVRVMDVDEPRQAVLLEALGPAVESAGRDPVEIIALVADVLRTAWRVPREPIDAVAPKEDVKAQGLRRLIDAELARAPGHLPSDVVTRARRLLDRRSAAWAPERAVVVHGDPHLGNLLPVLTPRAGAVDGHVLIDPDGCLADPAYDLGVLLREWVPVLAPASDPTPVVEAWCRLLADQTGVDGEAIYDWAYIERVTTGLHCLGIGMPTWGRPLLDIAARLR